MSNVATELKHRKTSEYLPTRNMFVPEPPNPYLMGGSTRIARLSIDTLVLNLYCKFTHNFQLLDKLERRKQELQNTTHSIEASFSFHRKNDTDQFNWNLQRYGIRFYPYVLSTGDITLYLSSREDTHSIPTARLHIGSLSSQVSALDTFNRIKEWLAYYGIQVVKDDVSRIDICHDFRLDIRDKRVKIYDEERLVFRAHDTATYRTHRKISGIQIGRGDIVLRIYDKLLEIKKPHNENKLNFFTERWLQEIEHRENPLDLVAATRVEFQLRKGALKQFLKIGCFSDFLNNSHKIWNYLTTEWFRHCSHSVDRKNRNQDKAKTSFFWKTVQSITKVSEIAERAKEKLKFKSESMLRAQVRGLLITLCAGLGHKYDDFFGMLATVQDIAQDEMSKAMSDAYPFKYEFIKRQCNCTLTC